MKKIANAILIVVVTLLLFSTASAAKSHAELKNVHSNLTTYVSPYLTQAKEFPQYERAMKRLAQFLDRESTDETENEAEYLAIISAYSILMRDFYNYSELEEMQKAYQTLNPIIFSEESWNTLSEAVKSINRELNSPTLFARGETNTHEDYQKTIDTYTKRLKDEFYSAYINLQLNLPEKDPTVEQYEAYVAYVRLSTNENLFKKSTHWNAFRTELTNLEDWIHRYRNPAKWRLEHIYTLKSHYEAIHSELYDLSPVQKELSEYQNLSSDNYSKNSWQQYVRIVDEMKTESQRIHYSFYLKDATDEMISEQYQNWIESIVSPAQSARQGLVSAESYNELYNLCRQHSGINPVPGAEIKLEQLNKTLKNGNFVLENPNSVNNDFINAIKSIEESAKSYQATVRHLSENEIQEKSDQASITKKTVIFTIVSIVLSAAFACLVSLKHYGKLNWLK